MQETGSIGGWSTDRAIKPLRAPPEGYETVGTVLYPYTVYNLRVGVRRLRGEPLQLKLVVYVDMVRAKGLLGDAMPETVEAPRVAERIPPRLSPQQALRLARRTTIYFLMRKFRIGLPPVIEVEEEERAYKIFLLVEGGGRHVFDTLTGVLEPL